MIKNLLDYGRREVIVHTSDGVDFNGYVAVEMDRYPIKQDCKLHIYEDNNYIEDGKNGFISIHNNYHNYVPVSVEGRYDRPPFSVVVENIRFYFINPHLLTLITPDNPPAKVEGIYYDNGALQVITEQWQLPITKDSETVYLKYTI